MWRVGIRPLCSRDLRTLCSEQIIGQSHAVAGRDFMDLMGTIAIKSGPLYSKTFSFGCRRPIK